MHFGVIAAALSSDPREAAKLARVNHFDGLLFDISTVDPTRLSDTGRREFLHILHAQDQQLVGFRADLGARGFGAGADVDHLLHRLDSILQAARATQASVVCLDLGRLPESDAPIAPPPAISKQQAGLIIIPEPVAKPPQPVTAVKSDPALLAQVDAGMIELGKLADRYNSVLALRSDLSSFAALDRALRQAACPWFGVDLDPVAMLRDAWEVDEIFSQLGALIRHVRARDASIGADRRTRPAVLGQGDSDFAQLIDSLDEADFHGWISIDSIDLPDRLASAVAGLNCVKSLQRDN